MGKWGMAFFIAGSKGADFGASHHVENAPILMFE
jgi:hypothetical protein